MNNPVIASHVKLATSCGVYATAQYLKKNGFSIQYALHIARLTAPRKN